MAHLPFFSQLLHLPWRQHGRSGVRRYRRPGAEELPLYQSPARLLALLAVSIFFGETCVMLLLHLFPEPYPITEALLDAGMLLIIVSPTLYFFVFRPFMQQLLRQQQSEEEIGKLSRRLIAVTEQERRRLAMDLHDQFGQVLTSLQMRLQRMSEDLAQQGVSESGHCVQMVATVRDLGDEVRRYATGLRPAIIDDLGIVPALEWLVNEQRRHHPELQVEFRSLGIKSQPAGQIAETVYRISQEALNNIVKHANARRVEITLLYRQPKLILTIHDDGAGFDVPTGNKGGIGLWSMRERAVLAGGRLGVTSRLGAGTTVRAELPMPTEA